MQQFRSLLKKELSGYFRSLLAYLVIFIYLFSSIGSAFYFGSYWGMHDSGVYSLFYVQPIILAVLIPAITMRTWADEYRCGTAEFLLTQPIKTKILVLSKYLAVLLFGFGMTIFLLPFIVYTAIWLQIDWINVAIEFLGVWLIIALFGAVGCLVSALNKSVIISYLVSIFITLLWTIIPATFLFIMYNDFMFAEIGLVNLLYFISFIAILLVVNIFAVIYKQTDKQYNLLKFTIFVVLVLLGVGFLNVSFYNFFAKKIDFTMGAVYTPKNETKDILAKVDQPINIDVYVAKEYVESVADYFHYLQQIKRFLQRYEDLSGGMVAVNITYVEPFSELEDNVLSKGMYFETNNRGTRDYLGAVVRSVDGREEVIRQFLLQRRAYLEKDLDTAIIKLLEPERIKPIGVYMDGLQDLSGLQGFLLSLESDYDVFALSSSMYEISSDVELVVLVNPKSISPTLKYAIDQYLVHGGKVLVFFDFYTASQNDSVNMDEMEIVDFLNNWQVNLITQMVDEGLFKNYGNYRDVVLMMNKATLFKTEGVMHETTPIIENEQGLLGVILEGNFSSLYSKNPYEGTRLFAKMKPFMKNTAEHGTVALISDVDFLEDTYWIEGASPDRNPYSVIEKSANGRAVKTLVDVLIGNEIYQKLPINDEYLNVESISQQITKNIYAQIEEEYVSLVQKIAEQRQILIEASGKNKELLERLLLVSSAGRNLASDEKKLQTLEYWQNDNYSKAVRNIMLMQIVVLPLLLVLILFGLLKWLDMCNKAKMKGKYDV